MAVPSPKAIGLLGGSFDPVHNGHVAIARAYLNSKFIDRLYVILSPDPPHKNDRELTIFEHRKKMLDLAFKEIENLVISTVEKELPIPSYTVNTVNYFAGKFPGTKLYLCIGEDSFFEFNDWYKWEEILAKCTLLVAKRPNIDYRSIPEQLKDNARFIDNTEVDISSSNIRDKIRMGKHVKDLLPEKVYSYIKQHHLYV